MLLLTTVSDKIQVITGAGLAALLVHASFVDYASGTTTPGRTNTSISTATTTDVVAAPASSTFRNVKFLSARNTNAAAQTVTLQHTDGTTVIVLWKGILLQDMSVQVDERGVITVFSGGGAPIAPLSTGSLFNASVSSVAAAYAADTYLVGSSILIPSQRPKVGTRIRWTFDMTKTAAGTATPIVNVRYGTNGSTADASLGTMTFGAGTANAETGLFIVEATYRTVGSGTSAVLQSNVRLINGATTGLASTVKSLSVTSSGHDSTTANTILGVSFNGGTSFSGTNTLVLAEMTNV